MLTSDESGVAGASDESGVVGTSDDAVTRAQTSSADAEVLGISERDQDSRLPLTGANLLLLAAAATLLVLAGLRLIRVRRS